MINKKILILGAGFGGQTVLKGLLRSFQQQDNIEITLINENNYFLFSPLLHEVAVGVLPPENICTPIRKLQRSRTYNFIQAHIEAINPAERKVDTSAGTFDFDYLILALGGVTDNMTIHNIQNSANLYTLKTIQDATKIKNQIIEMFEKASIQSDPAVIKQQMTFIILGGGYTGVQFAAGLSDATQQCISASYGHLDPANIKIVLLESGDRIIRDLPEKYSQYVTRYLKKRGIKVMVNSRVTGIENGSVKINEKETIDAQTLVYVPGVVANPLIAATGIGCDNKGRAIVNEYMEVNGFPGIYAVGDCAHYQDPSTGKVARPRAHIAVRQARVVAKNLAAEIKGNRRRKYIYSDSEEIISLGKSNALLRLRGVWIHGIIAVLAWVMSYSLLAFGRKNRLKIAIDWALSWMYGPDFVIIKPTDKDT